MVDAAVGSRGILGRGIEKSAGIPQGFLKYLNFNSADLGRNSKENPSNAITGFGGRDQGTPGAVEHTDKLNYDLTTFRVAYDLIVMGGAPASIVDLEGGGTGPWLIKIRPGVNQPVYRGAWFYIHEGGTYPDIFEFGRRAQEISLKDAANKRVEVDVTYTEPTGDTISGPGKNNPANTGTFTPGNIQQIASRGRRVNDADYLAGKSVYIKIVSIGGTSSAVVKAKVDVPGFTGSGTYGSNTFTIARPDSSQDGYATVVDSTSGLLMGLYGENFEPYEVTLGDQSFAFLAADDEFEFPVSLLTPFTKIVPPETRFSTFHLQRTARNADGSGRILIDSGTTKISRPYQPYYASGRKLPYNIDPTGDMTVSTTFKKRLYDRYFRDIQDRSGRLVGEDIYRNPAPLVGTRYEGIHLFQPQLAVSTLKSGDIPNKNRLDETITLEAEQPKANDDGTLAGVTLPTAVLAAEAVFDDDASHPWQMNIVTPIDPSFLL